MKARGSLPPLTLACVSWPAPREDGERGARAHRQCLLPLSPDRSGAPSKMSAFSSFGHSASRSCGRQPWPRHLGHDGTASALGCCACGFAGRWCYGHRGGSHDEFDRHDDVLGGGAGLPLIGFEQYPRLQYRFRCRLAFEIRSLNRLRSPASSLTTNFLLATAMPLAGSARQGKNQCSRMNTTA